MQKKSTIIIIVVSIAVVITGWIFYSSKPSQVAKDNHWEGDAYERSYSLTIGPDSAGVTIVEFFDPACEACRALHPYVKKILRDHPKDVRLVLRYAAFHKGSDIAVRILEAARQQRVFQPVLEALLAGQNDWASHHNPNINKAWGIAERAGLDISVAKEAINSKRLDDILLQENTDILALNVRKTPTFFVNKQPLISFGPSQLYELVLSELERSKNNQK